jgi:hypothetical protein
MTQKGCSSRAKGLRTDEGIRSGHLQSWLPSLKPEDLERVIPTPIGDYNLDQFLEICVIWHINAHCGEISALTGCQGLKGYPW